MERSFSAAADDPAWSMGRRSAQRLVLLLAVLVALALGGWQTAQAAELDEYRETLQAALADLERGSAEDVSRAISRLRAIDAAPLGDGTAIRPNNAAILADLEAQPPALDTAKARLRALLAELDRSDASTRASDDADARARLQRVLDRPEFRPAPPPNPIARFLQSIREAIREWLNQIFRRLPGGEMSPSLRAILEVIGLLAVAALISWVLLRFRREMGPSIATPRAEATVRRMTSEDARAEAERLARDGAFRAAARALYLAALLHWDEQGRLRFDRSLTNQEVLARARQLDNADLVAKLAPLVERFDRYWYGGVAPSPDDYAAFARLAARAWEGANYP